MSLQFLIWNLALKHNMVLKHACQWKDIGMFGDALYQEQLVSYVQMQIG